MKQAKSKGGRLTQAEFSLIRGLLDHCLELEPKSKNKCYQAIAKKTNRSLHSIIRIEKCRTYEAYKKVSREDAYPMIKVNVYDKKATNYLSKGVKDNVTDKELLRELCVMVQEIKTKQRNIEEKQNSSDYKTFFALNFKELKNRLHKVEEGQQGQLTWMTKDREENNKRFKEFSDKHNGLVALSEVMSKNMNILNKTGDSIKGFKLSTWILLFFNLFLVGVLYKIVFTLLAGIDIPWQYLLK